MEREISFEELVFFDAKPDAFALYEKFTSALFSQFPDVTMRVQKTQITFTNPKVFACVSFAKTRKAKDRPKEYIVVTFGLDHKESSPRIDVAVEPYPHRWTHHVTIGSLAEIDDELMGWVAEAYAFAKMKAAK